TARRQAVARAKDWLQRGAHRQPAQTRAARRVRRGSGAVRAAGGDRVAASADLKRYRVIGSEANVQTAYGRADSMAPTAQDVGRARAWRGRPTLGVDRPLHRRRGGGARSLRPVAGDGRGTEPVR